MPASAPNRSPDTDLDTRRRELATALDGELHAAAAPLTGGLSPISLLLAQADWLLHLATQPAQSLRLAVDAQRGLIEWAACGPGHGAGAAGPARRGPALQPPRLAAVALCVAGAGLPQRRSLVARRHHAARHEGAPPGTGPRVRAAVAGHAVAGQLRGQQPRGAGAHGRALGRQLRRRRRHRAGRMAAAQGPGAAAAAGAPLPTRRRRRGHARQGGAPQSRWWS